MTKEKDENFHKILHRLRRQFLCCYPVHCIAWQEIPKHITWEQQEELIESTCGDPLNQQQPIKISYQLNFLKQLLKLLEQNCTEVHDAVYEHFCKLQQQVAQDATQKFAYKHYLLTLPHDSAQFTLCESKSFVAEGTTGLCSWQASLALADYLLHKAEIVRDKAVLELGAGTGLCGFILTRCCNARQVLLTDGSTECVELMRENILRNFKNAQESAKGCFTVDAQHLAVRALSWHAIEDANLTSTIQPDVLLAADVVYDDTIFEELAHAIDYVFTSMRNNVKMFLAATVRNEYTLKLFLRMMENYKFIIAEKKVISFDESYLFWDRTTPVRILKLTRNV